MKMVSLVSGNSPLQKLEGDWAELTFAKYSGTVTKNKGKNWPIERFRVTFTPNGEREFVSRDQVFPLIVIYCLLLLVN